MNRRILGGHQSEVAVVNGRVMVLDEPVAGLDVPAAKLFEQCALWRPPAGSAFRGTPKKFVSGA